MINGGNKHIQLVSVFFQDKIDFLLIFIQLYRLSFIPDPAFLERTADKRSELVPVDSIVFSSVMCPYEVIHARSMHVDP